MSLSSSRLGILIQHKNVTTLDYSIPVDEVMQSLTQDFLAGTASEKCDLVFLDKRTLAGGATESLDLVAGSLTDAFGTALNFAKVRGLVVKNLSDTKILTVGNDANPLLFLGAGASTVVLNPKAVLALSNPVTGFAVTADTGDKLKIANNAGDPADYLVWIVGTSA